ncbi:hypothetical protein SAMN05661080_01213 [Modestobacter sp. DSM 44400]|uniref:hypothetical protein n=1 Tax=Modestobacter sp. DSM 44400 TaxID=1550230 RepID=UPI00089A1244|nr:hypothetical protein [Modestobacter sp. DSM 44400]SDX79145.1 hypothetical protein SAMN05661080_01213 [Modestobacter sp. DSM 44400]
MAGDERGVVFPAGPDGRRSTATVGRAVVAAALHPVDPTGARAAEQETNWRAGYLSHMRRTVEAGLASREAALAIADAGLDSLHARMRVATADGEAELGTLRSAPPARALRTEQVTGTAEPEREFTLPYRGSRLSGDDLFRRLDAWIAAGVVEPSCAEAVRTVAAHPEWLALPGRTVTVLGAGAEMGPLTALLRWGATVAGVDLPRPALWQRVLETGRRGAGTLLVPAAEDLGDLATRAGADLVSEVPEVADWLVDLPGAPVLGNYVYADGATNVRVSMAVDALTLRLQAQRPDVALAFLATPTDVFVVPGEAVAASVAAYANRSRTGKLLGRPLRTLSAGRLLRRAYVPGADPGISDSLVPQQGPNYALAKRLQRWRASVARDGGSTVSMNVAPPTRTRSVVKNRALAAAYAGADRFGVEVFEPATSNVLMAALLVHDLQTGGGPVHAHPWQDEAHAAAHGGLWRGPYAPRSALGLAAVLGLGAARG